MGWKTREKRPKVSVPPQTQPLLSRIQMSSAEMIRKLSKGADRVIYSMSTRLSPPTTQDGQILQLTHSLLTI